MTISVHAEDVIGRSISSYGIFDLILSETVFRLVDPGDLTVDVGANVGYVTSLMASRAGPRGGVMAFEPHPVVAEMLNENVARWAREPHAAPIDLQLAALSDMPGSASLVESDAFASNMGIAQIVPEEGGSIPVTTLDEALGGREVGMLKIDVEGHELAVVRGGCGTFEAHRVRDVIFEDFGRHPTPVTAFFEECGYHVFSLDNTLLRPLARPAAEHPPRHGWEGPSYLATVAPERALKRLRVRGWAVLGLGRVEARLAA